MFNLLDLLQSASLIWGSGRLPRQTASLLFSGSFNNLMNITEHGPGLPQCCVLWQTGHPVGPSLFTAESRVLYCHHFIPTRMGSCGVWKQRTRSLSVFRISGCPSEGLIFSPGLQFTVWEIPVFGEEIEGGTSFAVTDSWVTAGRHLWLPRAIPLKRNPALPPAKQLKNCLCHHVYLFANRRAARAAVLSLSRISLDTI